MNFFITESTPKMITIQARAEDPERGIIGDAEWKVAPGEGLFGLTFGELTEMGVGAHEIQERGGEMKRYLWSRLNRQQVGAFAEYFFKMELTMYGFQVYGTEVDDRGIDFIARYEQGPFIEIQVKSLRSTGYVFMQKDKFQLREHLHLALALLVEGHPPELYLIPSFVWKKETPIFKSREYEGLKSKPEWGLNISKKNMPLLEPYRFEKMVQVMVSTEKQGDIKGVPYGS